MRNVLVKSDAVTLLRAIQAVEGPGVDLCYIDPPFNLGTGFAARTAMRESRGKVNRASGPLAYEDRWGGIEGFLSFLGPCVEAVRDALAERGVLWIHLDHRAVHEVKVLCDSVFGKGAFRGEIIWAPGNGARARNGPSITHQTLLIYTKSTRKRGALVWNTDDPNLRESYAETSLRMHFRSVDEQGRRYRERVVGGKTYRYYADEGRRLGSVWTDIPAMVANTPIRREGTGYPTQKPEKLLERIILLSSDSRATICDPMCGSGTTLAVAGRLGRRFLGSDTSPVAIEIASKRLRRAELRFSTGLADAAR